MQNTLVALTVFVIFSSCNRMDDSLARAVNDKGLAFLNEGKELEARLAFLQAAQYRNISDSNRTNYLENVAVSYLRTPYKDSAKYYFKKALSLNPVGSYYNLVYSGYIKLIDNQIDSSAYFLEKAYARDSSKPTVNNLLGLLYMGEYSKDFYDPYKALKYNRKTCELLQDGVSKFVLAKNEYLVNNVRRSEQMFEELYREAPDYVPYLVSLIMIKQELAKLEEANKLMLVLKAKDIEKYKQFVADPIEPGSHVIVWNP
jgi:tetratricopeptide (TPR) repeat protein